jgi:GAF domain-containing protein
MIDESGPMIEVAEIFEEIARALLSEHDVQQTLDRIVNLAVEHLDACEYAGISFVEGRKITSPASSNDIPRVVDRIQQETDEGPCLDAIRDHQVFQTGDLGSETRWPAFALRAQKETGVTSVLSMRLFAENDTMGSLNLYSSDRDAFHDADVAMASVFATHAAVAMSAAEREERLERMANTRDVIGQAKGILMARENITEDEAFDMLRRASQRLNLKLRDVAEGIARPTPPDEGFTPGA